MKRAVGCLIAIAMTSASARADETLSDSQLEFFEARIRPVLVEHCYACHNSAEDAQGGLAVDVRDAFRKGGDGGELFTPGKVEGSRLLAILRHEIDGLEMPQDAGKLDDSVIHDFAKWIEMGAPDPRDAPPSAAELESATSWQATLERRKQWWSFRPIVAPELPSPTTWSNHPIDRFIARRWQQHEFQPSPRASHSVLIRRLFVQLIGLPPSPEQLNHWLERYHAAGRQQRDEVTAELVDELLESTEFGERWARHWMDWIRYAESHGSEGDPRIENAWLYRDYLIRALQSDVPYDQLVREHVAGDLIDNPRINAELGMNESLIGTAHWRMVFHGFAPTDALDEKVRFVDDQVNTFSKAFLGLTVSCARCHDHKFDAISQADYYALFGILASCRPARTAIDLPHPPGGHHDQLAALKPKLRQAIATDWLATHQEIVRQLDNREHVSKFGDKPDHLFFTLAQLQKRTAEGQDFSDAWQQLIQADSSAGHPDTNASMIASWNLATSDDFDDWFTSGAGLPTSPLSAGEFSILPEGDQVVQGVYPAGVISHRLSTTDPARLTSPDISLQQEAEVWIRAIGEGEASVRYVVQDYPRNGTVFPVANLKGQWNWQRFDLSYWTGDSIHLELATAKDAPLLVKNQDRSWFGITEARIVPKGSPPPQDTPAILFLLKKADQENPVTSLAELKQLYAAIINEAIESWHSGRFSDAQAEILHAGLRQGWLPNRLDSLPTAAPLVQEYRAIESQIKIPTRIPALDETTGRTQPLYTRGNHKRPADIIPRRFLEAIDASPYPSPGSGRLQLAEDLLREDNPLTRRVIVNRIWHHLFGTGIVATPDNFGRLGSQPTHPELLDWLAVEFSRNDWSLKQLIRLIVLSKTWQLDSTPSELASQQDPDNQLLSHANLRRMDAEVIRDNLLRVSGRLDSRRFGAPADGNSNRRSVYVRVIRNSLDPFLRTFDFPEPFSAVGRRDVTNVPAQSLTMMNDPQVIEYSNALAARLLADSSLSTDEARIRRLFELVINRPAKEGEVQQTLAYMTRMRAEVTESMQQRNEILARIERHRENVAAIIDPVRQRLIQQATNQNSIIRSDLPEPIGRWDFRKGLADLVGQADGQLRGGATLEPSGLIVRGGGHVVTAPLGQTLKAKTLEAWVKLDHLNQRGGGVITVQTPDGVVFDSIVFAEQQPAQWLAGSNNFARTQSFGGPAETIADQQAVHLAIVYHADGRIVGYRNGQPYGKSYQSNGPQEYQAEKAVVSFGVRHLPAGGNRLLQAQIEQAQLYDRALSDEQVAASAEGTGVFVSQDQVIASLTDPQRQRHQELTDSIERLSDALKAMGPIPDSFGPQASWADVARAFFTLQEFIYVR